MPASLRIDHLYFALDSFGGRPARSRENPHRDFSRVARFFAHRCRGKKRLLWQVRPNAGACFGSLRDRDERGPFRGSRLQRLHWPWSRRGDQGVADKARHDNSGQARVSSAGQAQRSENHRPSRQNYRHQHFRQPRRLFFAKPAWNPGKISIFSLAGTIPPD